MPPQRPRRTLSRDVGRSKTPPSDVDLSFFDPQVLAQCGLKAHVLRLQSRKLRFERFDARYVAQYLDISLLFTLIRDAMSVPVFPVKPIFFIAVSNVINGWDER